MEKLAQSLFPSIRSVVILVIIVFYCGCYSCCCCCCCCSCYCCCYCCCFYCGCYFVVDVILVVVIIIAVFITVLVTVIVNFFFIVIVVLMYSRSFLSFSLTFLISARQSLLCLWCWWPLSSWKPKGKNTEIYYGLICFLKILVGVMGMCEVE